MVLEASGVREVAALSGCRQAITVIQRTYEILCCFTNRWGCLELRACNSRKFIQDGRQLDPVPMIQVYEQMYPET